MDNKDHDQRETTRFQHAKKFRLCFLIIQGFQHVTAEYNVELVVRKVDFSLTVTREQISLHIRQAP
jgi:hypothetical protein